MSASHFVEGDVSSSVYLGVLAEEGPQRPLAIRGSFGGLSDVNKASVKVERIYPAGLGPGALSQMQERATLKFVDDLRPYSGIEIESKVMIVAVLYRRAIISQFFRGR